jgi:hypothetical protein
MSPIQYQQASYAIRLRDRLEMAGCDARVATVISNAVGELIDHVSQAESDVRRDIKRTEFGESLRATDIGVARQNRFDHFMAVTLVLLLVSVVSAVVLALLRRG